jgi:microcystin-dependent protein
MDLKQEIKDSQSTIPVGTVVATALEEKNFPPGWLLCNGQQVPQQYSVLSSLMSSVPNLTSRTIIGVGQLGQGTNYRLNQTGGEESHVLTGAELPEHSHNMPYSVTWSGEGDSSNCKIMDVNHTTPPNPPAFTDIAGGNAAHNNMQPYYVLNYMIYAGKL